MCCLVLSWGRMCCLAQGDRHQQMDRQMRVIMVWYEWRLLSQLQRQLGLATSHERLDLVQQHANSVLARWIFGVQGCGV